MHIYLASTNPGKLRDFGGMKELHVALLPDFAALPGVEEDGATFMANAVKKAEHYSRLAAGDSRLAGDDHAATGGHRRLASGLVMADDSGLEVAALGGAPGVYSARFAGRHGDDAANNRLVLERLAGVAWEWRQAAFVCVLAVAEAGHVVATFAGRAKGYILEAPRGEQGFGYDPLFYSPAAGRAFAELTPEEKARFSHRGQAARQLLAWARERAAS